MHSAERATRGLQALRDESKDEPELRYLTTTSDGIAQRARADAVHPRHIG